MMSPIKFFVLMPRLFTKQKHTEHAPCSVEQRIISPTKAKSTAAPIEPDNNTLPSGHFFTMYCSKIVPGLKKQLVGCRELQMAQAVRWQIAINLVDFVTSFPTIPIVLVVDQSMFCVVPNGIICDLRQTRRAWPKLRIKSNCSMRY
jgi:hypothetical protein